MHDLIVTLGIGVVAGAMNAIAGGGSFVTLPALTALGAPALNANATSTVALVPSALASAYAYRKGFENFPGVSMRAMTIVSIFGGACGAVLLLRTPQTVFDAILPWLLLLGSLAFSFGRTIGERLREKIHITPHMLLACQFVLSIYGGYFGGAVGIMMLAAWSLLTDAKLAAMQASRNILNAALNATAALIFITGGLILWPKMLALMTGAIAGGYGAAFYADRLDPAKARLLVSILTGVITILFFWKTYFA